MTLTQAELAQRLRTAREGASLTQEEVARHLDIPRSAIAQVEAGARRVSGLELAQLAHLYGRSIQDFVAPAFQQDGVAMILRALPEATAEAETRKAVLDAIALVREIINLEGILNIECLALVLPSYASRLPRSKWEAIAQGRDLAHQERQRVELGNAPLADPADILENQGVSVLELELPSGLSGFTVRLDGHIACGLNVTHPVRRQRFSILHEYCHALVDHDRSGIVSRSEEADDLREARANAFAIYFLAPEDGVQHALQTLSKGFPTRPRVAAILSDEAEGKVVEGRLPPRSQEIDLWHACWLAARFGVSTEAMIWHLFNLRKIDERAREHLHAVAQSGVAKELTRWFEDKSASTQPGRLRLARRRLVGLAVEAFRRDDISRAKLVELLRLAGVDREATVGLLKLAETSGATGLDADEA